MADFISVPFTPEELAFIREAFPSRATVEAIKLAALAEAGRRVKEISDAEKLLRDHRSAVPSEPAPDKKRPAGREPIRPLPITPKRDGDIERAAQALKSKVDAEEEARRCQERWAKLGPGAFKTAGRKRA